jgi:hypothetical protein
MNSQDTSTIKGRQFLISTGNNSMVIAMNAWPGKDQEGHNDGPQLSPINGVVIKGENLAIDKFRMKDAIRPDHGSSSQ